MQIALVTETAKIAGAEMNLIMIATRLRKRGHTVFAVLPRKGPLADRVHEANVSICTVPLPGFVSTSLLIGGRYKVPNLFGFIISIVAGCVWFFRLYRCFQRRRPDVVHTMSMWSHAIAGLAGQLAGASVVWHFQDVVGPYAGFGLYRWLVVQWSRRVPDCILCVSDVVADQFQGDPTAASKVQILENTVNTDLFRPCSTRSLGNGIAHPAKLTIGTAARLIPWKGQEVALRSARILKERNIPFHWFFAGDEALGSRSYRSFLEELVERWDLEENVTFLGWVPDMPRFYNQVDVLVHTPVEPEPMALALLEAMASGLPLVVSRGGGADHLIEKGGGILVPPRDPEAVANVLLELVRSPEDRLERGTLARNLTEQMSGLDGYVDQLVRIYRSLQTKKDLIS
ncbi:MAG TPA: glycosyltransferase family 1 protein [Methylothermaceae bacterium]|nr:glycosyltransferase family 1 protein [Methylothermaceae bacterium]